MKGDEAPELVTTKTLILRNKLKGYVYTHIFPKHCGVVYNKRRVLENFDTHPYVRRNLAVHCSVTPENT